MSDTPEWRYTPLSPDEISALAREAAQGRVFGTWNLGPDRSTIDLLAPTIWRPLRDASDEQRRLWRAGAVRAIYERMDRAVGEVKGFPQFDTLNVLDLKDFEAFIPLFNRDLMRYRTLLNGSTTPLHAPSVFSGLF